MFGLLRSSSLFLPCCFKFRTKAQKMKLSQIAIQRIKDSRSLPAKLMEELNIRSRSTIWRHINENEINGDLTKVAVIQLIKDETGLSEDEILEAETEQEKNVA